MWLIRDWWFNRLKSTCFLSFLQIDLFLIFDFKLSLFFRISSKSGKTESLYIPVIWHHLWCQMMILKAYGISAKLYVKNLLKNYTMKKSKKKEKNHHYELSHFFGIFCLFFFDFDFQFLNFNFWFMINDNN